MRSDAIGHMCGARGDPADGEQILLGTLRAKTARFTAGIPELCLPSDIMQADGGKEDIAIRFGIVRGDAFAHAHHAPDVLAIVHRIAHLAFRIFPASVSFLFGYGVSSRECVFSGRE